MEDHLSVRCVKQRHAKGRTVLMTLPELQTGTLRDKVAKMLRITMTLARRPEEFAVVVDDAVAHADLLLAVVVHVSDHEVVVALSGSAFRALVVRVKDPADGKLFVHNIDCRDRHAGVVTTVVDGCRMHTVQICDAAVEAVHTVAVVVAPFADIASGDREIDGIKRSTGRTLKKRHVLSAIEDITAGVTIVL